jgi:hypothetical protein
MKSHVREKSHRDKGCARSPRPLAFLYLLSSTSGSARSRFFFLLLAQLNLSPSHTHTNRSLSALEWQAHFENPIWSAPLGRACNARLVGLF